MTDWSWIIASIPEDCRDCRVSPARCKACPISLPCLAGLVEFAVGQQEQIDVEQEQIADAEAEARYQEEKKAAERASLMERGRQEREEITEQESCCEGLEQIYEARQGIRQMEVAQENLFWEQYREEQERRCFWEQCVEKGEDFYRAECELDDLPQFYCSEYDTDEQLRKWEEEEQKAMQDELKDCAAQHKDCCSGLEQLYLGLLMEV